jgi:hypothetical protein
MGRLYSIDKKIKRGKGRGDTTPNGMIENVENL